MDRLSKLSLLTTLNLFTTLKPQAFNIKLDVRVVPGVRANTEISPILYPLDNIFANGNPADPAYLQAAQVASGDYLQVFIPQDAGVTSVLVTPIVQIPLGGHPTITPTIPDGTALVYIILNGLEIMSIYDCKIPFWYPLIFSAQTLYLQNSNPSLTENYRFSVAFGIDG